jgi:hypothetical protein
MRSRLSTLQAFPKSRLFREVRDLIDGEGFASNPTEMHEIGPRFSLSRSATWSGYVLARCATVYEEAYSAGKKSGFSPFSRGHYASRSAAKSGFGNSRSKLPKSEFFRNGFLEIKSPLKRIELAAP